MYCKHDGHSRLLPVLPIPSNHRPINEAHKNGQHIDLICFCACVEYEGVSLHCTCLKISKQDMHHRRGRHEHEVKIHSIKMEDDISTSDHPYRSLVDKEDRQQEEVEGVLHWHVEGGPSRSGGLTEGLLSADHDARSTSSSSSSSSSSSAWSCFSPSNRSHADNMDMRYSMMCNGLFFLGSAMQTTYAIWDIRAVGEYEGFDDDDAAPGDDGWTSQDKEYFYINMAGMVMFMLNAAVELAWVRASRKYRPGEGRFGDDPKLDAWSAAAFGLAAILEFASSISWTDDTPSPIVAHVNMLSMHVYLLSGVLTLKGQGMSCSLCRISSIFLCREESPTTLARTLMELGGILFLCGCSVDVIMSWLYDPEISNISAATLSWGNLVSALLWLIDSILYTLSECILYRLYWRPVRVFALCVQSRVELPRVVVQRDDDATGGKLHV